MSDPRTKIEFLYKDVLVEVGSIVNQVQKDIPAVIDFATDKLHDHLGHVLTAHAELTKLQIAVSQDSAQSAAEAIKVAVEAGKLDVRKAATEAASAAIREVVGGEIAKVVGQVNNAANDLVKQTSAAKHEILGAARSVSWGFGRILGMLIAAGLIGGLVGALGAPYLQGRGAAPAPDQETAKRIEAGRDFIQLLPQLDNATREKVIRLIQKNRAAEQK
jgi:hypothetical protein